MPKADIATRHLDNAIAEIVESKDLYVKNPGKDFCRNRKLNLSVLIHSILEMKGGSLTSEMIRICEKINTPLSKSAFIQQRDKLKSEAFFAIFQSFNRRCQYHNLYRGYRLFAVDGCDINIHLNEGDTRVNHGNGVYLSQIHLNAFYDLVNHAYVDVVTEGRGVADERATLVQMYKRNHIDGKAIVIADRGYESLNVMAHFAESDTYELLLRVRSGKTGIKEITSLPMEELDMDMIIPIATHKKGKNKERHLIQIYEARKNKNGKIILPRKWDFAPVYDLKIRVVRFKLDTGEYETLVTTIPRDKFSLCALKDLYHMRWGIETSFRELKYSVGLSHIHGKSVESALQEIYAALIKYNYCESIIGSIVIKRCKKNKHPYVVNHTAAITLCLNYFRYRNTKISELEQQIKRYMHSWRPGRKDTRKHSPTKGFTAFTYRVAA